MDEGVGKKGVGENNPVQEKEEIVHEIEDKTGTDEEDVESIHESVCGDCSSLESVETVDDEVEELFSDLKIEPEQQPEPEEPPLPRPAADQKPPAVRKLDCLMDGEYWQDSMVGSVIHENCIGLMIKEYTNLEATLSTP